MPKVLHLLGGSADEQTRQLHQMVVQGTGPGFDCQTKTLGIGELRNPASAVLHLRRQRADITYSWGISALTVAVLAGHSRIFFSPDRYAGPKTLRWIRSLMGRANVSFVSPTFTQHRLAISRGIDPDHCRVIPPGVDFGAVRRHRNPQLRAALGLTESDYVILAPGESTLQTAHDQAVWTCGILNVLDPAYKLLLWGRGARAGVVAELGDRLGQSDMVKIAQTQQTGPIPFEQLLGVADLCLVTATNGAPTLPIAMCMAGGVPIISTVTYMLAELLEDRHTALMVPRRSPRALAQRVLDLRADPNLQARLVETARAEAYEHFSMTRMLEQYRQLYLGNPVAENPAAPAPHRTHSHASEVSTV
jgi:glycosyltransferase involved in cell wall biosynthesis